MQGKLYFTSRKEFAAAMSKELKRYQGIQK